MRASRFLQLITINDLFSSSLSVGGFEERDLKLTIILHCNIESMAIYQVNSRQDQMEFIR